MLSIFSDDPICLITSCVSLFHTFITLSKQHPDAITSPSAEMSTQLPPWECARQFTKCFFNFHLWSRPSSSMHASAPTAFVTANPWITELNRQVLTIFPRCRSQITNVLSQLQLISTWESSFIWATKFECSETMSGGCSALFNSQMYTFFWQAAPKQRKESVICCASKSFVIVLTFCELKLYSFMERSLLQVASVSLSGLKSKLRISQLCSLTCAGLGLKLARLPKNQSTLLQNSPTSLRMKCCNWSFSEQSQKLGFLIRSARPRISRSSENCWPCCDWAVTYSRELGELWGRAFSLERSQWLGTLTLERRHSVSRMRWRCCSLREKVLS